MESYPHHYAVHARAEAEGSVALESEALPSLASSAPPQYDGPGGQWSPETLFVAAVADCFILTFRAVAAASKLAWHDLSCDAHGSVEHREDGIQFTELKLSARLTLPEGGDADRAERLLDKAERACLVTNSLKFEPELTTEVRFA